MGGALKETTRAAPLRKENPNIKINYVNYNFLIELIIIDNSKLNNISILI
jgi:hypothetical protein